MRLTADQFGAGALDRREDADVLRKAKRFGTSIYLTGRAVEAMLRAHVKALSVEDEFHHDLRRLWDGGGLADRLPVEERQVGSSHISTLVIMWHNNQRWAPNATIVSRANRGLRGKRTISAEELADMAREAADWIIRKGEEHWPPIQ